MNMIEELIKVLDSIDGSYSVGVHGVTGMQNMPVDGSSIEVAKKITESGLETKGWGGILSNTCMFGQKKNFTTKEYRKIIDYYYTNDSNSQFANILVAVPESFQDREGKQYFLGHFNPTTQFAKGLDEAGDSLPLNKIVDEDKCLPKEFIVGYYYGTFNTSEITFVPNPDFIGFRSKEEQDAFFEQLKGKLEKVGVKDVQDGLIDIEFTHRFGWKITEYQKQLMEFMNYQPTYEVKK